MTVDADDIAKYKRCEETAKALGIEIGLNGYCFDLSIKGKPLFQSKNLDELNTSIIAIAIYSNVLEEEATKYLEGKRAT